MNCVGSVFNYAAIAVLVVLIPVCFSIFVVTVVNGISPMPSSGKVLTVIKNIIGELSVRGTVIELGSGWGSLGFPLAKKFPDIHIIGYENSPAPYLFCEGMNLIYQRKNISFILGNFFRDSFGGADAVVCYLHREAMTKLKPKMERELRPGCFVISNTFAVPGWKPLKIIEVNDIYRTKVYLYKILN